MANFWKELRRPFFVLAPMEGVTDTVFRQIVASVAKPDVFFTEFANVDALIHGDTQRLRFTEIERPIVAQIWGTEPEKFYQAAKLIKRLRFDGLDINLGCPERKIIKTGACAALIGQNQVVAQIITATRKGAKGLPISVKTRLGATPRVTKDWVGFLLSQNLAAITIHGRTAAEKSDVPARWDEIGRAVSLKQRVHSSSLIVGNGDVQNILDAKRYALDSGVDGVMIGRGIFQNLAIFNPQISNLNTQQKIKIFLQHIKLFKSTWGHSKNFSILKKFAKTYISGWSGAAVMRERLNRAKGYDQLAASLSGYLGVDEKPVLF